MTVNSQQHYDKHKRNQDSRSFYNSKSWQNVRQLVLIRDNHLCQMCLRKGKITAADMVHHIKPIDEFPWLALVLENLESLCHPCHNKEHPEKGSKKKEQKASKKIKVLKAKKNPELT